MKTITKLFLLLSISLYANEADVLDVKYNCTNNMICSFDVTIKHNDAGWDHYVDKYDVLLPNGQIIATRVLYHPHVDEQPFTRSIANVKIPKGMNNIIIRAHDSVHKYGGKEFLVKLNH